MYTECVHCGNFSLDLANYIFPRGHALAALEVTI